MNALNDLWRCAGLPEAALQRAVLRGDDPVLASSFAVGTAAPPPDFTGLLETSRSGYGELVALRHAAQLERTPAAWPRPSMPPGTHRLAWPDEDA